MTEGDQVKTKFIHASPVKIFCAFLLITGCSSKVLKHKDAETLLINKEYEDKIQVTQLPPSEALHSGEFVCLPEDMKQAERKKAAKRLAAKELKKSKKNKRRRNGQVKAADLVVADQGPQAPLKREPDFEDAEGFTGRRPNTDPFRPGEKVTLELSYFGVTAGDLVMEVKPFVDVNGRKAYNLSAHATSTSVFAMFYAVNDTAETFVDFEKMIPTNYSLHVKESKQLREVRSLFDWDHMRATLWDKKVTKESGVEEKKDEWDILPYSQNVFSGPFYLRTFQLEPGKKLAFRLAHEGKNYVITGEVLRRDKLSTPIGELKTIVMRPKIELGGIFQPVGDILFWLTDDDRKFIVKIESKIKIGKIVGMVKSIEKGVP